MSKPDSRKLIQGMREASRIMGHELYATDRFICQGIEWLSRFGKLEIEQDEGSFDVRGTGYCSPDDTLHGAITGAIFAQDHLNEIDNATLVKLAEQYPPPQEWFEESQA